jgi:hypothetical protein
MPRMMAHPRQSLDDRRHAGQRPEVRAEPIRARPRAQRLLDLHQLLGSELGLAPGAPGGFEARSPVRVPGVIPVVGGHPRDPQGPRHRARRRAPRKQSCRLEPPGFQRGKIPARTRWSGHVSACDRTREIR